MSRGGLFSRPVGRHTDPITVTMRSWGSRFATPHHRRERSMSVSYTPSGFHTATPYLVIKGAAAAIDFYKKVFSATEIQRMPGPGGSVMHAEIKIGDSVIMLGEEMPGMGSSAPTTLGGTPVGICLYFPDVD